MVLFEYLIWWHRTIICRTFDVREPDSVPYSLRSTRTKPRIYILVVPASSLTLRLWTYVSYTFRLSVSTHFSVTTYDTLVYSVIDEARNIRSPGLVKLPTTFHESCPYD